MYNNLQTQAIPSQQIRRKINVCAAVTVDLLRLIELDFSKDREEFQKWNLRIILDNEYTQFIYRATIFRTTSHSH